MSYSTYPIDLRRRRMLVGGAFHCNLALMARLINKMATTTLTGDTQHD